MSAPKGEQTDSRPRRLTTYEQTALCSVCGRRLMRTDDGAVIAHGPVVAERQFSGCVVKDRYPETRGET